MLLVKSILMPLSSSGEVQDRLLGALAVTKFFGSHLEILHAQISPRQFIPVDAVARNMPQKLLHELEALADKYSNSEASELQSMFIKLCEQNNIVHGNESITDRPTAFGVKSTGFAASSWESMARSATLSFYLILGTANQQPLSKQP